MGHFSAMVKNKKLEEDEFFRQRKEVLSLWPTGNEVDLDEAIAYRKALPGNTKLVNALANARLENRTLIGAHIGHATVEQTLEAFQAVQEAGADFSNLCTDTYSRRGRYAEADRALQGNIGRGESFLNGFPIVNHGVEKARYIRKNVDMPLKLIDGDSEHCQLLTEIGLAAGFEHSSTDIECLLRTSKNFPLQQKIAQTQYQNRLAGYYTERGAPVQVNIVSHLCGFDPPGIKVALAVLHSLLVAEQGIKHIAVSLSLAFHLVQDVAALRLVKELVQEYLKRFNYEVTVSSACFQFLGPWPRDKNLAIVASTLNSAIPILAGADFVQVKSVGEAYGIPTKEENVIAIKIAKKIMNTIGRHRLGESEDLRIEKEMMRAEAKAIIDKTLELGDGDAAMGQIIAVESGVIDVQYSPYRKAKGLVFPLRDNTGAIRYLTKGNLPLPAEVMEYQHEKIDKRRREGQRSTASMLIDDVGYLSG